MGYISSIETTGCLDGPGIRVVVFFQGCGLRCQYCHNPETWELNVGTEISTTEIIEKILHYKPYFGEKGGVTISGGEPLMQPKFLIDILKRCKELGIHTCIDTAGFGPKAYFKEILNYTDLVLFDIKATTNDLYQKITGQSINCSMHFFDLCCEMGKKLWIRQVIVPGLTDKEEYIDTLIPLLKPIKTIEKIEFLPYHTYGAFKYENLGLNYVLKKTEPMNQVKCEVLYQYFLNKRNLDC